MKTQAYLLSMAIAALLGTLAFVAAPAPTDPALWVSLVIGLGVWAIGFKPLAKRVLARNLAKAQAREDLDRYLRIREGRPYLEDLGF
jgi:hypothetical protein